MTVLKSFMGNNFSKIIATMLDIWIEKDRN